MPARPLSEETRRKIVELLKQGLPQRAIAARLGVSSGSVHNVAFKEAIEPPTHQPKDAESLPLSGMQEQLVKALKRSPLNLGELADELDISPKRATRLVDEMRGRGVFLLERDGRYDIGSGDGLERQITPVKGTNDYWTHRFGIVSDNHLCNRHSRLDVLKAAYDTFEREGITTVLNPGNWIDGEHRFTRPECIVRPGLDSQIEYMLENYPERKGITTRYIAGDDHEGWYQQRECIEVGRYLQLRAEEGGRNDLKYLGYAEADIKLESPGGSACLRVVHPGGGSSYAISYTDQKRVESYQGGEKPQVEIAGHYHKYNVGYPREVTTIQAGCTCDQTLFMRKKRLQAMVGFLILEIKQDHTDGHIIRTRHEWFPFYNHAYYERRFS